LKPVVSIIIPTWNLPEYFTPCVESIVNTGCLDGLCELIVVNNGLQNMDFLKSWPNTKVITPGKNLGWEGGLAAGVKEASGDFFCFQNDDTLIPKATQDFYLQLLWPFNNKNVAAVGPTTTVAAGWHSIFRNTTPRMLTEVSFLIFFTVMVRRTDYEAAGGVDTTAPGGDDLDLCMRFRKMGKNVLINPDAFIIHHAFKTGERVKGTSDKPFGWNSKEMSERTNRWLIQKHGFKAYMETMRGLSSDNVNQPIDLEGEVVREFIRGPKIVELGCGYTKTVPQAIGVDRSAKGEAPSNLHGIKKSVADIQADVTNALPESLQDADTVIARHILEHSINTIATLRYWSEILKTGGRLIIAVPNQDIINSIPLNPEHVHAFTPESLKETMELCGFKQIETRDPNNGMSFVSCFEKVLNMRFLPNGKVLETVNA
jgi:GT2 family glycosyltransferase